MNNNSGALSFDAYVNNTDFKKQIDQMQRDIRGLSSTTEQETKRMDAGFSKLGVAIGGALSFAAAQKFIGDLVRVRGEFQQLEIAFTTMLGSKARADALMADVVKFAATTPFDLSQVAAGTKQLLAYGFAAEQIQGNLSMLGNVASGVGSQIGDLIYLYGTLKASGRVTQMDINQFAGRGIPIYAELAKTLNVNVEAVRDLVSSGKIGFAEIEKSFQNMTSEGGMFFNLMQEQSKSLTGQISNLGDAWDQMLNEIGRSNEGLLSSGIAGLATLVENYEQVGKILVALVATYGTYRAAVIVTTTLQTAMAASTVTMGVAQAGLAVITGKLRAATELLNATLLRNPYVAIFTAVAALGTAIWALSDDTTTAQKVQAQLNEENEKATQIKEDLKNKTEELIAVIRNENATRFQQAKAFQELQKLYPELYKNVTLEAFAARDAAEAQKELSAARDAKGIQQDIERYNQLTARVASLTKELREQEQVRDEANKKGFSAKNSGLISAIRQDLIEQQKELEKIGVKVKENERAEWEANATVEEKIGHYKQIRSELEAQARQLETTLLLTRNISGAFGGIQTIVDSIRLDSLNSQIAGLNATLGGLSPKDAIKNKAFYESQKKAAEERFETALPNTAEWTKAKGEIESANKALEAWSITKTKAAKIKKDDIILPSGSVAEFNRQIKNAEEALSKIPANQTARIAAMHDTLLSLTQQRTEAEKLVEFHTWQETLEEKQRMYADYEKAVENTMFPGLADKQYASLLEGGKTYYDFLKSKMLPLQEKIAGGKDLNANEGAMFFALKSEIDVLDGVSTPFQRWKEDLEAVKVSSDSLVQYLEFIYAEMQALEGDTSTLGKERMKALRDEAKTTAAALKTMFRQFQTESNLFQTKRTQAEKRAIDLTEQARKELYGENLKLALDAIEKEKKETFKAIAEEEILRSDLYKSTHNEVLVFGRKQVKEYIDGIKEKLKHEEMAHEQRKAWEEELAAAQRANMQSSLDEIAMFANAIGSVAGDASIEFTKHFKVSFQQLAGLANSLTVGISGLKGSVSKGTAKAGDKIMAGAAIGDAHSTIIVAVRNALLKDKHLKNKLTDEAEAAKNLYDELEGINLLIAHQIEMLDGLFGEKKINAAADLYKKIGDEQAKLIERMKGFSLDVIESEKEYYVDPVFGTKITKKGFAKVYTELVTAGQAMSNVKIELGGIDTSQLDTLEKWIDLLAEIKLNSGNLDGKKVVEADVEALEFYIQQRKEMEGQLKSLEEFIKTTVTGTTAEAIADGIVEGFRQGKRSSEDFADDFNKLMQQALISSFKQKILDDSLAAFYERFYALSGPDSNNVLTPEEIEELRKLFNLEIDEANKMWETIQAISGQNFDSGQADALQGAIKGMSEETASILSGQMNAIRINQADGLNLMRDSIFHLTAIEFNTRYLEGIARDIRDIRNGGDLANRAYGVVA